MNKNIQEIICTKYWKQKMDMVVGDVKKIPHSYSKLNIRDKRTIDFHSFLQRVDGKEYNFAYIANMKNIDRPLGIKMVNKDTIIYKFHSIKDTYFLNYDT